MNLRQVRQALRERANPEKAKILQGFFKTGPGQYGEGDTFLGIPVPELRKLAREYECATEKQILVLLHSAEHEARLLALLIMVHRYSRGASEDRNRVHRLYVDNLKAVNNWDLVDLTAPNIVGEHLLERSKAPLLRWAKSDNMWERRVAIVATHAFIRRGRFSETLNISAILLKDTEDLIHKAVGWMLREVGKRNQATEEAFLRKHYRAMPRTMLRYAIERFPEKKRRAYLRGLIK